MMDTLEAYINACRTKRVAWGSFDCFTFAAGAVEAKTGVDHMATLRGYNDETSANILLRERFGSLDLRQVFLSIALEKAVEVPLSEAQNGDIACVRWPGTRLVKEHDINQQHGLGVVWNREVLAVAPNGLVRVPLTHHIVDVWRF